MHAASPPIDPLDYRSDKVLGLAILGATFVICLGISMWAKEHSAPDGSEPPAPPTTEGIEGFPKKVDPIGVLPRVREVTPRTGLRGFVAEGVAKDGTIDLTKKGAKIRYSFQSGPHEGPQPEREGGTLPETSYCGKQSVWLKKGGLVADHDVPDFPCPVRLEDPLPHPRCTLQEVWKKARRKGAPSKKEARIEYYASKAGPAYRFSIPGTKHKFTFYGDCERELKGAQASGDVP